MILLSDKGLELHAKRCLYEDAHANLVDMHANKEDVHPNKEDVHALCA